MDKVDNMHFVVQYKCLESWYEWVDEKFFDNIDEAIQYAGAKSRDVADTWITYRVFDWVRNEVKYERTG